MAMDVEYEEYSSTSSSKHHGWKLEVSRRHRETQEMEALEERLAVEYARIDQGLSVGDLTAPRATRLIAQMDRSGRLPGAVTNGSSRDREEGMFVTYPDREGLCGALPTLDAAFGKGEEARESDSPAEARGGRLAALVGKGPLGSARESLASRLVEAMPLIRTRGGDAVHAIVSADANDRDGGALRRAAAPLNGAEANARGPAPTCARRPDRLVEYDVSIGVDRARRLTDAELNERAGAVNGDGEVVETAFRDLNRCD